MTAIKSKRVGIAVIRRLYADLVAENKVYVNGQMIWSVDDAGNEGLKLGTWDPDTTDISMGTAYVDLPWKIVPAPAGAAGFTPFDVDITMNDPDVFPYYQVVGGNMVITDPRFVNVPNPLVISTSTGTAIRPENKSVDTVAGVLTITGIAPMEDGDVITIVVPTQMRTADSLTAVLARLTVLELLTAPILAGAKFWWPLAAGAIPAGWQICTAMAGCFPLAQIPGDPVFGLDPGTPGGSLAPIAIGPNNLPRVKVTIPGSGTEAPHTSGPAAVAFPYQKTTDVLLFDIGKDIPDKITAVPAYLLGNWIEIIP